LANIFVCQYSESCEGSVTQSLDVNQSLLSMVINSLIYTHQIQDCFFRSLGDSTNFIMEQNE